MEGDNNPGTLENSTIKSYPSLSLEQENKILDDIFMEVLRKEFLKFEAEMAKIKTSLQNRVEMFEGPALAMKDKGIPNILIMVLQDQTQFFNGSILNRMN
jgi:hypothetical protein